MLRASQAADTFLPYDLEFADNVVLQIKNGPIDFQAREPVSPLFSSGLRAASGRPLRLLLELQATQVSECVSERASGVEWSGVE